VGAGRAGVTAEAGPVTFYRQLRRRSPGRPIVTIGSYTAISSGASTS